MLSFALKLMSVFLSAVGTVVIVFIINFIITIIGILYEFSIQSATFRASYDRLSVHLHLHFSQPLSKPLFSHSIVTYRFRRYTPMIGHPASCVLILERAFSFENATTTTATITTTGFPYRSTYPTIPRTPNVNTSSSRYSQACLHP